MQKLRPSIRQAFLCRSCVWNALATSSVQHTLPPSLPMLLCRYSEFHSMHQKLRSTFPRHPLPSLPRKILFGRSQIRAVAQQRMTELQRYLKVRTCGPDCMPVCMCIHVHVCVPPICVCVCVCMYNIQMYWTYIGINIAHVSSTSSRLPIHAVLAVHSSGSLASSLLVVNMCTHMDGFHSLH